MRQVIYTADDEDPDCMRCDHCDCDDCLCITQCGVRNMGGMDMKELSMRRNEN